MSMRKKIRMKRVRMRSGRMTMMRRKRITIMYNNIEKRVLHPSFFPTTTYLPRAAWKIRLLRKMLNLPRFLLMFPPTRYEWDVNLLLLHTRQSNMNSCATTQLISILLQRDIKTIAIAFIIAIIYWFLPKLETLIHFGFSIGSD